MSNAHRGAGATGRIGDGALQEFQESLRVLRRNPGFAAIILLTLALGIGLNTALFSVLDAVLLRPLPFPNPEQLTRVFESNITREVRGKVATADFLDWQQRQRSFAGMAAYSCQGFTLAINPPEYFPARCVTTNYFEVLGVSAWMGRTFQANESQFGSHRVVVLSHEVWRTRFNAARDVIGRDVMLNGESFVVVGVLPEGFEAVDQFGVRERIDLFTPLPFTEQDRVDRGSHNFDVVARLAPAASLTQAQDDLDGIARALEAEYPKDNTGRRVVVRPLSEEVVGNVRTALLVLFGAVALVLLLACTNIASLMLSRAIGQQRDTAIRIALGASRFRIIRRLLIQNVLLAAIGGGLGVLLAYQSLIVLREVAPASLPRLGDIALNGRVLLFAFVLAVGTGLASGLVPALQASSTQPYEALERRARGSVGAGVLRWRDALMVGQVALAFVLLVAAGLLLKSFGLLRGVDVGFEPARVLALRVSMPAARFADSAARVAFCDRIVERVVTLPGVEAAAFASNLPLRGGWGGNFTLEHARDPANPSSQASFQLVSPGYFKTMGIPVRQGRLFTPGDREGAQLVAIVNEALANQLWEKGQAIGARLKKGGKDSPTPWLTIVGIVGDVRLNGQAVDTPPEIYFPSGQFAGLGISPSELIVRATNDPRSLLASIRAEVVRLDREQALSRVQVMSETVDASVAQPRFNAWLLTVFAALALVLAVLGIYGVVAYAVNQRTAELGLRLALGAEPGALMQLVIRRVLTLVAIGIALGSVAAWIATRSMANLLFGIRPHDPATFVTVMGLLIAAAFAAGYVPARRITRVDPVISLRIE